MTWRWFLFFLLMPLLSEWHGLAMDPGIMDIPSPIFVSAKDMVSRRSLDDSALKQVNELNAAQRGAPLDPRRMLSGPNALTLTVLDEKTFRPIAGCVVHGVIVTGNATPDRAAVMLGRLESKRTAANGACRYEGLGWLDVRFELHAKGYLFKTQLVSIPGAGGGAIVRLTPGATVKGRLVDDATGKPLAGVVVKLEDFTFASADSPSVTDADGNFAIDGLPANKFKLILPGLPGGLQEFQNQAMTHAQLAGGKNDKLDPQAFQGAYAETLNTSQYIAPRLDPIDLRGGGTLDLGTIRLQHTPMLDLQILYEDSVPLGNFPFTICYYQNMRWVAPANFKTDADGRARLSLAGWKPGMAVGVYVPSHDERALHPKKLLGRRADPQATLGEKEWYEFLINYDYSPRTLTGGHDSNNENSTYDGLDDPDAMEAAMDYDRLTPGQREGFRVHFEKNRQEYEAFRVRHAAAEDHPNYEVFTPEPGEVHALKFIYKPTDGEVNLILNVRDKITKAPLARFAGFFDETAEISLSHHFLESDDFEKVFLQLDTTGPMRGFRSLDATGQVVLPAITFSPEFLKNEKKVAAGQPEPGGPPLTALKKKLTPGILIDAPGYVRQLFKFTADELRAAKELKLELEPAAAVRGRVVLAGSGEPLTSATLREVLLRAGRATGTLTRFELGATLELGEASADVEKPRDEAAPEADQPKKLRTTIGAGGRFELGGLRTGAPWTMRIQTYALPRFERRGITLQPGMNDLGTIEVGTAGWLAGRFTDERGAGIGGVAIDFPTARLASHDTTMTRPGGDYQLNLLPLEENHQLVRLVPPWGADAVSTTTPGLRVSIAWDAVMTLDRCASNTLSATLDRGQRLRLELPRTAQRDALERILSDPRSYQLAGFDHPRWERSHFAIRAAMVQGLAPGPAGLVYSQRARAPRGLPLTTATLALELEHVPPGRYAVVVEGTLLDSSSTTARRADEDEELLPLACGEVELGRTSATLTLAPSLANVELSLADPSAAAPKDGGRLGAVAFFDREGARSSFQGAFGWRMALRSWYSKVGDPEVYFTPLLGFMTAFMQPGDDGKPAGYRPALLRAVPPGRYRLRVFYSLAKLEAWPPRPDYETTIEIPAGARTTQVRIP